MRIALGLEYCGTGFHGWQSQPQGQTVQDELELALRQIAGESIGVICAGRTDAGVHATQQVVHFETRVERPLSAWVRGVNAHLPDGVAVRWAQPVSDEFHARFSARGRRYRYLLINRAQRPGLWQGRVGWFHLPLDLELMQLAASLLGNDGGAGGLGGLVAKFQQAGLGDVVSSWIGSGQNQAISPDQLGQVLGQDTLSGLASQFGLNSGDAAQQLAGMLPGLVDALTPAGSAPAGGLGNAGDLVGALSGLLKA